MWKIYREGEGESNQVRLGREVDFAVSCSDGVPWNVERDSHMAVSVLQAIAVHELQRQL